MLKYVYKWRGGRTARMDDELVYRWGDVLMGNHSYGDSGVGTIFEAAGVVTIKTVLTEIIQ